MADFKPFSLADSQLAGQQMAMNRSNIMDANANRAKSTKAAGLRQRVSEGDEDALGELMAIDPEQASNVMKFLNTAEDRERDSVKQQNEGMAKAVTWVMQAGTEQERAQRWDQSVDHMVQNQGNKDASKYKGKYSQGLAQNLLMQSMTMDQLLSQKKGSFGNAKAMIVNGQPAMVVTDKSGTHKVLDGVTPTQKDQFGSKSGGKGGREIKASDSNAIANAAGNELNVPFTKLPDGGIKFQFATDEQAKQVTAITARAEQIFSNDKSIGHRGALLKARQEVEAKPSLKDGAKKPSNNTSAKDWLSKVKPGG